LKQKTQEAVESENKIKYQQILQSSELHELKKQVVMLKSMIKGHKGMLNNESDREL